MNLTQRQIAIQAGLGQATVNRALLGETAIAVEAFVMICRALGLSASALIEQAEARLKKDPPRIILGPLISTAEVSLQELVQ